VLPSPLSPPPDSVKPKFKSIPTDIPGDECGESMVIRTGRTGPFLGCGKYPKCKNSKPLPEGVTAESFVTAGR
jgi:ssDNA-binding Zn-finger/Zn-ribbon topoisomerase 1